MGWFGVGIAMFSIPVSELTGIPLVLLIIISGCLMTGSAYFGIKSLEIVSWVAVPAVAILGCISVGMGSSSVGGIANVFANNHEESITFATAVTLVVGSCDAVFMGLHVCQMMGYEEIQNSYKLITYNAAKTLHLGTSYGIKEGNAANFIILNAKDFYQALNEKSSVLYSIRNGKILYEEEPVKKVFHI